MDQKEPKLKENWIVKEPPNEVKTYPIKSTPYTFRENIVKKIPTIIRITK